MIPSWIPEDPSLGNRLLWEDQGSRFWQLPAAIPVEMGRYRSR